MLKYLAFPFKVKQSAFITKIKHLCSCLLNKLYCFQAKILYFSKFVIDYKKALLSFSEKFKMARTDQKRKLDSSLLINGESAKKSRLNGKTDLLKMMMDDDCRFYRF